MIIEAGDDVEVCPRCGIGNYLVFINPDGTIAQMSIFESDDISSIVIIIFIILFALIAWQGLFALY